MSAKLMVKAMHVKVGNPIAKLVLIKLAENAKDDGKCWPSHQHIASFCECSRASVKKYIKYLEEGGLLKKEVRKGHRNGKGNASNIYYLTLNAADKLNAEETINLSPETDCDGSELSENALSPQEMTHPRSPDTLAPLGARRPQNL